MDVLKETTRRVRLVEKSSFDLDVLSTKPFPSRDAAEKFLTELQDGESEYEIEDVD